MRPTDPDQLVEALGRRVLIVHAHPDDESISTGGTVAALISAGADVWIVTATRGERGEVMPGEFAHLEGDPGLVPVREAELCEALIRLGDPRHTFLGTSPARSPGLPDREYVDSGMRWGSDGFAVPATDAPESAFSLAPHAEGVADLDALAAEFRPTSVVSYDSRGGYGHPDHVIAHRIGLAVARGRSVPFFAIVEPRVSGSAEDFAPTLCVELGDFVMAKSRAMAAHATQLTIADGHFTLTGGQTHPVAHTECFRRLEPPVADRIASTAT